MKTAVSVPDEVFRSADVLARKLKMSRSQLYATAVAEFVAKHRSGDVTARLDAVYSKAGSRLDKRLRKAQANTLRASDW
jgi:metal-responsive CopG/Arc/MetJ family transcriptional regulator